MRSFKSEIVINPNETDSLARDFSKTISEGVIIVLNGNLGSGKTFFIKKVLNEFGINNVNSPSFTIVNEHEGEIKAYHFDFYRLKNIKELYDIGWQDYINDRESVIFIEWGELLSEALPG
ncbi:MAG: tRNA (adenosine(37)-N6)-threonylcarbamoyltransferase complex ATPase subunit type 1 TsaE, partial [Ignavibacteria bacterium]